MKANTATANIVAEMRDRAKRPDFIAPGVLRDFADRIEVTWKREIAEVEASALDVGGVVEASRHTGNAAAMREALDRIGNIAGFVAENCDDQQTATYMNDIISNVQAALAAPPRNCDRFQVAAEALTEWQSLVKAKPNTWDFRYNYWLFATAKRKGNN